MAALLASQQAVCRLAPSLPRSLRVSNGSRTVCQAADNWLPGSTKPKHLTEGVGATLPANFGWDPLGLGANEERLTWFAESERVHARWAMLAVAGILVQEIVKPDIFWYDAPLKVDLPFNIVGLVLFELVAMHWVETKRGLDIQKPNSQNQDPIFTNYSLPEHTPGYPGGIFAPFIPEDLETLKLKELKNGRLAMLAFVGFTMAAQVTGKGPLAALGEHLNDPINTTIFSKAVVIPGQAVGPTCQIPSSVNFQGLEIPTPCFLDSLWP
jgi:light-harvesting complex I chlorophyll a/b binding protein 4